MIRISITDNDGKNICTNVISDEKAKFITETHQWNYVMDSIFADVILDTPKKEEE